MPIHGKQTQNRIPENPVRLKTLGRILGPPPSYFSLSPSLGLAALLVVSSLERVQVPGIGIAPVRHTLDLLEFPARPPTGPPPSVKSSLPSVTATQPSRSASE